MGVMKDMTSDRAAAFAELVREAGELVEQAARARKRTLALSPEVAALLERVVGAAAAAPPVPERAGLEDVADLETLRGEVAGCRKCGLAESRTQTVFGAGNPHADLVFVGEAPGEHEDLQGVPFVGRAGGFLTDVIEKGLKMTREDVFICNVLKCRPPGNRDPQPNEKEACEPYLVRQLAVIKPKVICALGSHAAKMLLKTEGSVGQLRGKWHFYQGIPVRVTYHPSYIVRSEHEPDRHAADKRKVWDDIKEVIRVLNGEITPRPNSGGPAGGRDLSG
ncbi:MAG TPA: uracil-DNA glycosylase [Candidatus Hydrogenedentes bacterium]|jgi:DNA polymerase|nr:uracil-DNA glycosylase [Candidatus Hydrogenedentota bacterium]MDY0033483.1 uracil-DNA glycosylase [FCB group bacterium]HNZ18535.1 uracil-DNA glycosylase [Candidatus Hydrogenedentota bacterium]